MKYLALFCILFLCTLQTYSQQDYFIYVQTDNSQPFYIKINNNVYSSSSAGYLILSKLPDSITTVTIGFPKNIFPEQQFSFPVNHKDAGYVLKNAGEKGWTLFNLQTMEVIRPKLSEEKKKSELTGNKREDAFSLLLSAAANDTSVLYTTVKPPRAAPVAAVESRKDSQPALKTDFPLKDSVAIVKTAPEKNDSLIAAKTTPPVRKDADTGTSLPLPEIKKPDSLAKKTMLSTDSIAVVKNKKPSAHTVPLTAAAKKDSLLIAKNASGHNKDTIIFTARPPAAEIKKTDSVAKNIKPAPDTIAAVKTTIAPHKAPSANTAKKDSLLLAKNASRHNKDTIIFENKPPAPAIKKSDSVATAQNSARHNKDTIIFTDNSHVAKEQASVAKNKKQRRDTIIMMNGNSSTSNKDIAKNTPAKKEKIVVAEKAKDSVQIIKKEILQAPEEKRDALLNNKDAVMIEKVPAKNDSAVNKAPSKKDTIEMITQPAPVTATQLRDTVASLPRKRLRPLVNKMAELNTDTSYIAIFVDESNEKFDTIRISIPFNDATVVATSQKPAVKIADSSNDKTSNNNTAANHPASVPEKTDTGTTDKNVKENAAVATQPTIIPAAPVKADTAAAEKNIKNDSIPAMVNREKVPVATQKDSLPAPGDSSRVANTLPKAPLVNADCKEIADDSDIDKLRIKMLVVTSDDDRVTLAKKLFKQKCILAKQVRALSELFSSDEGRYKWLDAAYPFVSDPGNFSSLGDLIKDGYYFNRFRAMLRH